MSDNWPLLDFSKFPNEAISGQTLSQINAIMSDTELSEIPQDVLDMLNQTENSMKPTSSINQEKHHVQKLLMFLSSKNIECDLNTISEESLNNYLRYFYHELRTKNGQYYSPASLKCIRAGIHRHITQALNRNINIINGNEFASSNRMMKTMAGLWLSHGGEVSQYDRIEDDDLKTIFSSFNRKSGEELQNEAIFSLLYYLGARGREELRRMKRSDLSFGFDSDGIKYAFIKTKKDNVSEPNNIRKNVKASLKEGDYSNPKYNRIYDEKAVECLEMYLSKLQCDASNNDNLFPRPVIVKNRFFSPKQVRGINFIGNFMKNLSKKLNLKKMYTNHCVRCTTVSRAKEMGMSSSDICRITGHKDQRSVDRYDRPSDARRRQLTSVLNISETRTCNSTVTLNQTTSNIMIQGTPEKKMKITVDANKNILQFDFS